MSEERVEDGAVAPGARGADFSAMVKIRQDDRILGAQESRRGGEGEAWVCCVRANRGPL